MNKIKKIALGFSTLALVLGTSGFIASSVNAYKGDPTVKGPNYSVERHTAMENALETNDYTAWKNLMTGRGRVNQVINQDNFAKFAQIHKLVEKGDLEGAKKIRQELGLGLKDGPGLGMGNGFHRGTGMHGNMNR